MKIEAKLTPAQKKLYSRILNSETSIELYFHYDIKMGQKLQDMGLVTLYATDNNQTRAVVTTPNTDREGEG